MSLVDRALGIDPISEEILHEDCLTRFLSTLLGKNVQGSGNTAREEISYTCAILKLRLNPFYST